MALLELHARGVNEAAAALDRLAAALNDKRDPLTEIAEALHMHLEAAYTAEGVGGDSGPWAPLTRRYGAWKHRHGPGVPILVGLRPVAKGTREHPNRQETYVPSGKMRRQILAPLEDAATWRITLDRMRYTAESGIAIYHQEGTRHMKARPPVDPPRVWLDEIDSAFGGWLDGLITERGF